MSNMDRATEMNELEELKKLIKERRDQDYDTILWLVRGLDALESSRDALFTALEKYKDLRSGARGHLRDFYDYVVFSVLQAVSHAENARRLVHDVLRAYEGRGSYWEGVEGDD
jgi:N-glycosylase/DNA lyase